MTNKLFPVAVIGGADDEMKDPASEADKEKNKLIARDKLDAFRLGRSLAEHGFVVICGGRNKGIMEEVARGSREGRGICIGLLPRLNAEWSSACTAVIRTDLGNHEKPIYRRDANGWNSVSRNRVLIQSAEFVFAVGGGDGTANELRIAKEFDKRVFWINSAVPQGITDRNWQQQWAKFSCHPDADSALASFYAIVG